MKNFWKEIQKPIFILAPMENVTDTVFRQIVASCGRPTVFFTEFTSCDGLTSEGKKHVDHRLRFTESERPIVAQIWGAIPENFYKTAQMVKAMGFDGVDINMGCPDRTIVKKGGCSALIQNPHLAAEIIQATREGAGGLPVSVKTRIGFNMLNTEEWTRFLLEQKIDALTLHLRTVKEESRVPAHWDEIRKAVQVRNDLKIDTILIGNGDIKTRVEAHEKINKYGIDGVMIGRGIFENIWLFNEEKDILSVTPQDKLKLLISHIELYDKTWGNTKSFPVMRKFVKAYVNGFPYATDMRGDMMTAKNAPELIEKVSGYLKQLPS